MSKLLDTVLLLALPASGKSEVRKYLDGLSPVQCREEFHMHQAVQLDDYPYVHFMHRIDDELAASGGLRPFYKGPNVTAARGLDGAVGTPAVTRNRMGLWTDSRHFLATGKNLPEKQGIEHSGVGYLARNPVCFDPEEIIELALEGGCNGEATSLGVLGAATLSDADRYAPGKFYHTGGYGGAAVHLMGRMALADAAELSGADVSDIRIAALEMRRSLWEKRPIMSYSAALSSTAVAVCGAAGALGSGAMTRRGVSCAYYPTPSNAERFCGTRTAAYDGLPVRTGGCVLHYASAIGTSDNDALPSYARRMAMPRKPRNGRCADMMDCTPGVARLRPVFAGSRVATASRSHRSSSGGAASNHAGVSVGHAMWSTAQPAGVRVELPYGISVVVTYPEAPECARREFRQPHDIGVLRSRIRPDMLRGPDDNWPDIGIHSPDSLHAVVVSTLGAERYSFEELGFAREDNGKPNSEWIALMRTCEGDTRHRCRTTTGQAKKQQISKLRRHLKDLFGLKDNPFYPYSKSHGWLPKFDCSTTVPGE